MFITRYNKGRPRGFPPNKAVYVCEARYNEDKYKFNKIKTWTSCLPDEVRERDYEMDLFEVPRTLRKVPSPIKHLLQADAKETDAPPKPTWGSPNAPPIIGAVHRRPREANVSSSDTNFPPISVCLLTTPLVFQTHVFACRPPSAVGVSNPTSSHLPPVTSNPQISLQRGQCWLLHPFSITHATVSSFFSPSPYHPRRFRPALRRNEPPGSLCDARRGRAVSIAMTRDDTRS